VSPPEIPDRVRREIERDLRPVKPLATPWVRALALSPVAAILIAFVLFHFGFRDDFAALGQLGWSLSTLEAFAGLAFVALALTDAVPGRTLSIRIVYAAFAAGAALVIGITFATLAASPTDAPPELVNTFFVYCLEHSLVIGLPALVAAAALAARALPIRPLLVGSLYGFGAGLFADAGWRLFCAVSAPSHVLLAHGGAVVGLTIVGSLSSHVASRLRWRRGSPAVAPPNDTPRNLG
jgi:hypothetical protein